MNHPLDLIGLKVALGVGLEVDHDLGAARNPRALGLGRRRDLETRAARRGPDPGLRGGGPAARHFDAVGHHEGRIEADPELADQPCAVVGLCETFDESAGA